MKLNKLLILFTLFTAVFSASVSAQQETTKPSKEKKANNAEVKKEKSDRKYMLAAKGGCYYITDSGKKTYVDKKFCDGTNQTTDQNSRREEKAAAKTEEPKTTTVNKTKQTETVENKNGDGQIAPAKMKQSKAAEKHKTAGAKTTAVEPSGKTNSNGRTYITGPRGGCYYLTGSGKKVYVSDKSLCGN